MKRRSALLTGSLGIALLVGCEREAKMEPPAPHREEGVVVVVRDSVVDEVFEATGTAQAILQADLSTRLMGKVVAVSVQAGQPVRSGQVLARIDGQEMAARSRGVGSGLDAARSQLELARTHAARVRRLYADSAATKAMLDQAETDLQRAQAGLSQLEAQASELASVAGYATITAPFPGMVTARLVDPGALAAPGQPLLRVEDATRLRVSVNTTPEKAARIQAGSRLEGRMGARPFAAVVEGVVPSQAGNLVAIHALVDNRHDSLRSGAAATLLLPRGKRLARLVPEEGLVREGDLVGVWGRGGRGDVKRWIRIGSRFAGGRFEVLAGLQDGDTIVVPSRPAAGR